MIGYSLLLSEPKESGSVFRTTVPLSEGGTMPIREEYDFLASNPSQGFALRSCLTSYFEVCPDQYPAQPQAHRMQ